MPFFSYRGRDSNGLQVKGTLEAGSSHAVADQLMEAGIMPVQIRASRMHPLSGDLSKRLIKMNRHVKIEELMLFSRQCYSMLKAGVPIMDTLTSIQEYSRNPSLKATLAEVRTDLDSGLQLSQALASHPRIFSEFYISMIKAGEQSGTLENAFLTLASHIRFDKQTKDSIKAAMRYPTFVVVAIAIAMVVVNIFVIPTFAGVFRSMGAELPEMTRMLIAFSDFMVHSWRDMLLGLVLFIIVTALLLRTEKGRKLWDRFKLRIPIIGKVIYKATMARFARSLGSSYRCGIPIVQGLEIVGEVIDNKYLQTKITAVISNVEQGRSLTQATTATNAFDPLMLQMIHIGEDTGDLDGLLIEIGEMYEREVEYDVSNLSQNIEPVLIVLMAAAVLFFALAIYLPMWDYSQATLGRH